jgi:hypothetical protein
MGHVDIDLIYLTHRKAQWWRAVNTVQDLRVQQEAGNCISWATAGVLKSGPRSLRLLVAWLLSGHWLAAGLPSANICKAIYVCVQYTHIHTACLNM